MSNVKSPRKTISDGAYEASLSGCQRSSPTQDFDNMSPQNPSSSQLQTLNSNDLKVFERKAGDAITSGRDDLVYQSVLSRLEQS